MTININIKKIWSVVCKIFNICWKIAAIIIGIVILIAAYGLCEEIYEKHYGAYAHADDAPLGMNICVHSFGELDVRVYNKLTEEYVTPRLRWVDCMSETDSLTAFCDNDGKCGFLSVNSGKIVMEGRYEYAYVYSEGLAAVVENSKLGFIDLTGRYVIEPTFICKRELDYAFKQGLCRIVNEDGKQGLINTNGEWLIKPEYDDISWVESSTESGYLLYGNYTAKLIAADGTVLNPFVIDEIHILSSRSSDDYYEEGEPEMDSNKVLMFRVMDLWGMMDAITGKILIPAKYNNIRMISDNIVACDLTNSDYDNLVLYDTQGNVIGE